MMVANWVMAIGRRYKIAGYKNGSLVYELIKCVLAIGAGFAPNNRTGIVPNVFTSAVNAFAIAFHVALLKIGGKAMHVLVVRENGLRLAIEEVGIPKPYKRHDNRNIFFEGFSAEMVIGGIGAF